MNIEVYQSTKWHRFLKPLNKLLFLIKVISRKLILLSLLSSKVNFKLMFQELIRISKFLILKHIKLEHNLIRIYYIAFLLNLSYFIICITKQNVKLLKKCFKKFTYFQVKQWKYRIIKELYFSLTLCTHTLILTFSKRAF